MMTMRSIFNAVRGYNQKQEDQYQSDWTRARFIAFYATIMAKVRRQTDLIKFPWDEEEKQGDGFDQMLRELERNDFVIDKIIAEKHGKGS